MISLQSSVICFQEGFFQHDFSKQFFSVAYFGVPNSKNNQDLGVCQNGLFWCAKINNQASKKNIDVGRRDLEGLKWEPC